MAAVALVALMGAGATPGDAAPAHGGNGKDAGHGEKAVPRAPRPEPIRSTSLPLPPTAPTAADGSVIAGGCTNDTGCLSPADTGIQEGPSYLWDGEHVVLPVVFEARPPAVRTPAHRSSR